MSNRVVIDQTVNTVTTNTANTQNVVVLNREDPNSVSVIESLSTIVEVGVPGPRGEQGIPGVPADISGYLLTSSFNQFSASYNTGSFTGSFYGDGSQLTGIVSSKWSGSNPITRNSDVQITGSLSVSDRVQAASFTGSLFGTASFAAQIPSDLEITASSLYVNNDLYATNISAVSASFGYVQTVTGSAIVIGEQYIVLNTQTPAARYAGLQIYDSGSMATSSIVWDSERNNFVYENVSGSTYSGGGFLAGPRNSGSLADVSYPTLNRILRSQGGDHVYDSNLSDNNEKVSIAIPVNVTGSVNATEFTGSGAGLTNIPASGITGLNLSQIATGSVSASVGVGSGSFQLVSGSSTLLYVSSSGNVGIGTNSPTSKFEVVAGSDANGIKLRGRSADNISNFFFSSNDGLSQYGYLQHRSNEMRIVNNVGDIVFYNGPSTILTEPIGRWFSTGNLLIQTSGTLSDAGFKFDVNGTARIQGNLTTNLTAGSVPFIGTSGVLAQDNSNFFYDNTNKRFRAGASSFSTATKYEFETNINYDLFLLKQAGDDIFASQMVLAKSRGTTSSPTVVNANDRLGSFVFAGYDTTDYKRSAAIIAYAAENYTSTANGSYFSFFTTPIGSASSARREILRLLSSGNLIIQNGGTFTDTGERLQVSGSARITNGLIASGSLTVTGSSVSLIDGTFSGSGANLYNIPASGITGLNLSRIATGSISASVSTDSGSFQLVSGSSNLIYVSSSGNVGIGTNTPAYKLDVAGGAKFTSRVDIGTVTGGVPGNLNVNNTIQLQGFTPRIVSADNASGITWGNDSMFFVYYGNSSSTYQFSWGNSGGGMYIRDVNSGTRNASAKLQIDSTTTGFLPPRMSNLQRIAVSAPAQGLMVYDTGSASEGLYYYSSGSIKGWTKTLNDSGSQSISGSLTVTNTAVFGGSSISSSAQLQVDSSTRGFLPPRMTEAQRDLISSPASGLIIYNTTSNQMNVYNGTSWGTLGGGSSPASNLFNYYNFI